MPDLNPLKDIGLLQEWTRNPTATEGMEVQACKRLQKENPSLFKRPMKILNSNEALAKAKGKKKSQNRKCRNMFYEEPIMSMYFTDKNYKWSHNPAWDT